MSAQTTADDHYDAAIEHLEQAKEEFLRAISPDVWGHGTYQLRDILLKVSMVQDILDE